MNPCGSWAIITSHINSICDCLIIQACNTYKKTDLNTHKCLVCLACQPGLAFSEGAVDSYGSWKKWYRVQSNPPESPFYTSRYSYLDNIFERQNFKLVIKNKNMASTDTQVMTTHEVAARFNELAKQEKWFDIQDELFAENVRSIDPPNSPYMGYAEGKAAVRKKGEEFVQKIEAFHGAHTSDPVVAGNHFAVGRELDITVPGFGRIQMKEIMLYEVKDGQIVSEQFFY